MLVLEEFVTVCDEYLHCLSLLRQFLNCSEVSCTLRRPHQSWCKDNRQVLGVHPVGRFHHLDSVGGVKEKERAMIFLELFTSGVRS